MMMMVNVKIRGKIRRPLMTLYCACSLVIRSNGISRKQVPLNKSCDPRLMRTMGRNGTFRIGMRRVTVIGIIPFINAGFYVAVTALYCTDIRQVGSGSRFTVQSLKTLSDQDLVSCLVFLGKDPLGHEEGRYIWDRLSKMYDGVASIPESDLQQLGWIARAIPVKDIANLTIGDIDTIAAFGQYHNLSQAQLQALAEQVRDDWGSKEPTDYTFYDLMALKHILCGFNRTAIELIHPDSYKGAASVLSTLQGCAREPLEALAELAVSDDAFGDPSAWHSSQVKSVGCVLNGLSSEDVASIPPEGIESITPDIIPCLRRETLRAMSPGQLSHLTPSAAAALTYEQKSGLSGNQRKAVDTAYEGKLGAGGSNAGSVSTSKLGVVITIHLLLFGTDVESVRF